MFIAVNLAVNMLSGGLFPLEVFGDTLQTIFNLLPFKYIISFPINIINGKLDLSLVWNGLFMQLLWICILTVIAALMWKRGTRKYIAVGG